MLFINIAALFAIVIAVCGGIPHPKVNTNEAGLNIEHVDNSQGIPHWLGSAVSSLKNIIQDDTPVKEENGGHLGTTQTSDLSKVEEDEALPVLIHKEGELSGIKLPLISDADKTNPFMRTKRSTCATSTSLPQLVEDLKSFLTPSQFLGLNPQAPVRELPQSGINLRSTCPWNLTEVDLGANAFPRYINKATCLCEACIESTTMRCEELNHSVSYLYLLCSQDGLAIMETRNIIIPVGCHCVSGSPQSNETSTRSGPITK